jgi:hypothetical protein
MDAPHKNLNNMAEDAKTWLMREQTILDAWRSQCRTGDKRTFQLVFSLNSSAGDPIDLIRQFEKLTSSGITPPTNVLLAVANFFRTYLEGAGKRSLDEAFKLKPKQRSGHPLSRRLVTESEAHVLYWMWCVRQEAEASGKSMSIEEAAGKAIACGASATEDKLKKCYVSRRIDSVFGKALAAMKKD